MQMGSRRGKCQTGDWRRSKVQETLRSGCGEGVDPNPRLGVTYAGPEIRFPTLGRLPVSALVRLVPLLLLYPSHCSYHLRLRRRI